MTSPGTFLVCNPMSFFQFCISHRPYQRLVPYLFNEPPYFDSSINIARAHGGSVEVFGADLFIDHSFMPLRTIASTGRRLKFAGHVLPRIRSLQVHNQNWGINLASAIDDEGEYNGMSNCRGTTMPSYSILDI